MFSSRLLGSLVVAMSVLGGPGFAQSNSQPPLPARYTAFAVSTGDAVSDAVASQVEIAIDRWSSAAESTRLMAILKEKGANALLEALQDLKPVGSIKTPGNLAYELRYALVQPGEDGGTRIFLATDRPISYWEAVNQPRTIDYPFTFIELRVNKDGEGEGKLALATKLTASRDGSMLELENYQSQPIQLNQIRRSR